MVSRGWGRGICVDIKDNMREYFSDGMSILIFLEDTQGYIHMK